jgi:Carboxypeptidase regulatory-like domain
MQMKRLIGIALFFFVTLVTLTCHAQLSIPLDGVHSDDNSHKTTRPTSKLLTGIVIDKTDKPIPNAVVYLKNTKTLAVKTYISQTDGTYRFPELSLNSDYEVFAEKDGSKSKTKTVSQFDDRDKPNINLRIDTNK